MKRKQKRSLKPRQKQKLRQRLKQKRSLNQSQSLKENALAAVKILANVESPVILKVVPRESVVMCRLLVAEGLMVAGRPVHVAKEKQRQKLRQRQRLKVNCVRWVLSVAC